MTTNPNLPAAEAAPKPKHVWATTEFGVLVITIIISANAAFWLLTPRVEKIVLAHESGQTTPGLWATPVPLTDTNVAPAPGSSDFTLRLHVQFAVA
jgi:hypothetical protein